MEFYIFINFFLCGGSGSGVRWCIFIYTLYNECVCVCLMVFVKVLVQIVLTNKIKSPLKTKNTIKIDDKEKPKVKSLVGQTEEKQEGRNVDSKSYLAIGFGLRSFCFDHNFAQCYVWV